MIKPAQAPGELTEVETIDHEQYGITMKIVDFTHPTNIGGQVTSEEQHALLGTNKWGSTTARTGIPGLLSTYLVDGYPITNPSKTKQPEGSLSTLFANATQVNHLFLKSIYTNSGYYEFDSTQNYATLVQEDGTIGNQFTVYEQLGTHDTSTKDSLAHGQFFPYNTIVPGVYAQGNKHNKTDALENLLPDSDPRKDERLYKINDPNYYFGVELEATFTQTPSGKDAWGHDIIYEFTGDDDFWLYVDGELIIDLGGIHSAISGKVNYSTGEVIITRGTQVETLSLYEIFEAHYREPGRNLTEEQIQQRLAEKFERETIDGQPRDVFRDYTDHTMRIFYMERGAGASNLDMRFNLASVKPGSVLLSKELSGVNTSDSYNLDFPFQAFYLPELEGAEWLPITPYVEGITVCYQDTEVPVRFMPTYRDPEGVVYENVFLLKPGQKAVMGFPAGTMEYYIKECSTDTDIYTVSVNGDAIEGTANGGASGKRKDFAITPVPVEERKRVTYDNHVGDDTTGTLQITKWLFNEDYSDRIPNSEANDVTFTFRLYLGNENTAMEDIELANMHNYHVKNPQGQYCRWDEGLKTFVPLESGKTVFEDLTAAERNAATFITSMYGSISKIPVDYIVEVRDLTYGAKYKVEERFSDTPDGYSLKQYWKKVYDNFATVAWDDEEDAREKECPTGSITATEPDHLVRVDNVKGYGLRVNKVWTDEDYMLDRDPVYLAVYYETDENHTLSTDPISGTIYRLPFGQDTQYWFFEKLLSGVSFDKYVVREVLVENPTFADLTTNPDADPNQVVSCSSVTPIRADGSEIFEVYGTQKGGARSPFNYRCWYTKGEPVDGQENVYVDKLVNKREGIEIYKVDENGDPLQGAVFTLKDPNGVDAGAETYTSDEDGLVTIAYLHDATDYTLTEIASPVGYHALQTPLTIRRDGKVVTVTPLLSGEADRFVLDDTDYNSEIDMRIGKLTITNVPYTVQFIKKSYTVDGTPLEGVHFALYAQVLSSNGTPRKDYHPVEGYDDLVTGQDGSISELTTAFQQGTLPAGSYYLSELEAPDNYLPLSSDILFTVDAKGAVSMDASSPDTVVLATDSSITPMEYTFTIPNEAFGTSDFVISKKVDATRNAGPYSPMDAAGHSSFSYTAKLYYPDGKTPWNYTEPEDGEYHDFVNGIASFSLSHNESKTLHIPTGAVVVVTEDPNDLYTTQYRLNKSSGSYTNGYGCTVTVSGRTTLDFNNNRSRKTVKITKKLTDPLTTTGTFRFRARLIDNGDDITANFFGEDGIFTIDAGETKQFLNVPVGSVLTISEVLEGEQAGAFNVSYDRTNGTFTVGSTTTLTATNTRTTQKVTVQKQVDPVNTDDEFNFTATIFKLNGDPIAENFAVTDTLKTNSAGQVSFTLKHNESIELTVPHGAKLVVTEGQTDYSATASSAEFTDSDEVGSSFTVDAVNSDGTISFLNSVATTSSDLTITKNVTGAMGNKNQDFTFTLVSVADEESGTTYAYTKTDKENVQTSGTLTTGGTFTLKDSESIVITVPQGKEIALSEENGHYSTTWQKTGSSNVTSGDEFAIVLDGDAEVTVTNNLKSISPTGVSLRKMPFIIMGIFSTFMIMTVIIDKRRRRQKLRGIRKIDPRKLKGVINGPED